MRGSSDHLHMFFLFQSNSEAISTIDTDSDDLAA